MLFSTRGTHWGRLSRIALMGTLVLLLIGAQANAQALPQGCIGDPPIFANGPIANFTSGSPTVAGTSFAAAEASTNQAMELVAQRRRQEEQACPAGAIRVGGVCQPIRSIALTETRTAPDKSQSRQPASSMKEATSKKKAGGARRPWLGYRAGWVDCEPGSTGQSYPDYCGPGCAA
jgi:hypothetical protein